MFANKLVHKTSKLVKRPSGRFPTLDMCYPALTHSDQNKSTWSCIAWTQHVPCSNQCPTYTNHVTFAWHFLLDRRLRLNMTFITIFISSGDLYCNQGNLTVRSIVYCVFCGHNSFFNLYLLEYWVDVCFHVLPDICLKLNAIFSVFDPHMFHTAKNHRNMSEIFGNKMRQYDASVCSRRIFTVYSFYIQVLKLENILVSAPEPAKHLLEFIIYDGPGHRSTIVTGKHNVYRSSTFQCTLQVLRGEPSQASPMTLGKYKLQVILVLAYQVRFPG